MGKNTFISYKYKDNSVRSLKINPFEELYNPTIVRNYVDILQEKLRDRVNINLGEKDGEDLSAFSDETIASKLRDKIFNSSLTIVLISPNMKDKNLRETDQWIPWEISYSLKEVTREDRTSRTNAVLAIVLPDKSSNPYGYFIKNNNCYTNCGCKTLNIYSLFKILHRNMFNQKNKSVYRVDCPSVYAGFPSYIHCVTWDDFLRDINKHINTAYDINNNINDYNIVKDIA